MKNSDGKRVPGFYTIIAISLISVSSLTRGEGAIRAGDILVSDYGTVVKVDPLNGDLATVPRAVRVPQGITVAPDGAIIVADIGSSTTDATGIGPGPSVVRIDPDTGAQSFLSSGGGLRSPNRVAVAPNGDVLVADADIDTVLRGANTVFRINMVTGEQSGFLGANTSIGVPSDLAMGSNNDYYIIDQQEDRIWRVNAATKAETLISSGGALVKMTGIAVAGNGDIYVCDIGANTVFRIDPVSGQQTVLASGLAVLLDIAVNQRDEVFVLSGTSIVQIDTGTGAANTVYAVNAVGVQFSSLDTEADGKIILADPDTSKSRPNSVSDPQILRIDISQHFDWQKASVVAKGGVSGESVAVDGNGDLLVLNSGKIKGVDAGTAVSRDICCSDLNGGYLTYMTTSDSGEIFALTSADALIRINRNTGEHQTVTSGGLLTPTAYGRLRGIAIDANGDILVAADNGSGIVGVDPSTGVQKTVVPLDCSGGLFCSPVDVAVNKSGDIFILEGSSGRVLRFDRDTGQLGSLASLASPADIAIDPNGDVIVLSVNGWTKVRSLLRVDVVTGQVSSVTGDVFTAAVRGLTVANTVSNTKYDITFDFAGIGLWAWVNDAGWIKLNNNAPDQVMIGDVDGNGQDDIIADFDSTLGGIFVKRNLGGWTKLHNLVPELMAVGDLDNNGKDDVVIDFGGIGLWARMNDTSWLKLNNNSPERVVVGDMDGNGRDDVIADFGSTLGGVFVKRNLGAWSKLHNFASESLAVGDLDNNGKDDLVIDFGGIGLWARMNDAGWLKLHNTSSDLLATGDVDGNGADDVLATFTGLGLWQKLNLGGWNKLNNTAPDALVMGDMNGNGQDDVVAGFGSSIGGIYVRRAQGAWVKLHNASSGSFAAGNLDGQ